MAEACLWGQKIEHFDSWVEVTYTFLVPDKRKRDVENLNKAVSDFLVNMGIIKDDSDIRRSTVQWADDKPKGSGAIIEVKKL